MCRTSNEQLPTLHQVIERIYTLNETLTDFITDNNHRSARNFANDLHMNLNFRYANNESLCKWRRTANFLAPQYKGIHLTPEALEDTKRNIKLMIACSNIRSDIPDVTPVCDDNRSLSPTSRLRKQYAAKKTSTMTATSSSQAINPVDKEFSKYELYSLAPPSVDILEWYKKHQDTLPLLSRLAMTVLTIPCSSAKSERVFSCAGNFVTPKRNKLGLKKIEDLVIIKQSKTNLLSFKSSISESLERGHSGKSFRDITIETVQSVNDHEEDLDHAFICSDNEESSDSEFDSDIEIQ